MASALQELTVGGASTKHSYVQDKAVWVEPGAVEYGRGQRTFAMGIWEGQIRVLV